MEITVKKEKVPPRPQNPENSGLWVSMQHGHRSTLPGLPPRKKGNEL